MSARNRGRCLLGVLLLLASATAMAASREFDIAAGPATQTITRFAQQAGLPVLFPYDLLQGKRTPALRGRYEVHAGLRALLQDSGLIAYINKRGQVSIRPADPPQQAAAASSEHFSDSLQELDLEQELPEATVTGTRIARDGMTTATPVAVISSDEIASLGPSTLVDALTQLPHFLNSDTPQTQSFGTSGAAGASHLNLRGIGSIRTLTLLDGRRIVPSTRLGTVDVALLPRNLIRRVEVVTGGASAAYGSDAVTGVVNMMLDTDFRGLRGHVQGGLTELGDYQNQEASLAWGTRVGGQSSLLLSGEYFHADGIRGYDTRSWFNSTAAIANPAADGPGEIIAPHVHATGYTYGGLITAGPLAGTQFLPGGVPAPFERGNLVTGTTQSGGSGVDPAADLIWLLPDQERISTFARFTTQPSATASGFVQVLAARSQNYFDKDPPSLWGPWEATIYRDNAFLPQQIRDRMDAAGVDSFRMGRVAADGELGRSAATLTGRLLLGTIGFDKHFDNWSVESYYQYGLDRGLLRYHEALRLDRIYRGIDSVVDPATGRTTCRSTLSFPGDGCVPVNLFGQGSVSPQARAWLTEGQATVEQDVHEQTAETTVRGDLPWTPAGRLSVAAGASWRAESARSLSGRNPRSLEGLIVEPAATQGYRGLPVAYSGNANIFERATLIDVGGHYTVWEAFGEVLAPLVKDARWARHLDLHAALREARYSGSGSITAWKLGLDWQVTPEVRLRATRSRDIRAGNLSERFDSATAGVTIIDKLRDGEPVYAVVGLREGNPAIDPEKSDTTTAGFVLQPAWAPSLSVSADYYDIRIDDAISPFGVQNIIDGCADGAQDLCALIERNGAGLINRVHNRILNIAEARARGIDLELSWQQPVTWLGGGETLALRLFATRALETSTRDAKGVTIDRAGQTGLFNGAPRLQANFTLAYQRGRFRVAVREQYISSGSYNATYVPGDIDRPRVRSAQYTNLNFNWQPTTLRGTNVFLNVQNLLDEDPPRSGDWGFGGSIPTNEGLFDVLGRRVVAGVRFEF